MQNNADTNSISVVTHVVRVPENNKTKFTDEEKAWCRPIAETLAMLDGNAFFGTDTGQGQEWYEQYLPEAWAIFNYHGGINGWASETSWMKDMQRHESPAIEEAYNHWRLLKRLCKVTTK